MNILVIDDDEVDRLAVARALRSTGLDARVEEAGDVPAAAAAVAQQVFDAVLLDFQLPGGDGLDVLRSLRNAGVGTPVIVLTAYASIDNAVEAVKLGAEQFFTKPVELDTLLVVINRVLENRRNQRQVLAGAQSTEQRGPIDPFLGSSSVIVSARSPTAV